MKNNKTMLALGLLLGAGVRTAVPAAMGMAEEVPMAWAGQPAANETTASYTSVWKDRGAAIMAEESMPEERPMYGPLYGPRVFMYEDPVQYRTVRRKLTTQEQAELKTLKAKQKVLETELNAAFKERAKFKEKFFNPVITSAQREALAALAEHSPVKMKAAIENGFDVNVPINEYTILMHALDDLEMVKFLIENCKADVNEAVWQPNWGHYVTALDCCDWHKESGEAGEIQKQMSVYLTSEGAELAGPLGFWSDYNGDYVGSEEGKAIKNEQQISDRLAQVKNQIFLLTHEKSAFDPGDIMYDYDKEPASNRLRYYEEMREKELREGKLHRSYPNKTAQ